MGYGVHRQAEHDVSGGNSNQRAHYLSHEIPGHLSPREVSEASVSQRDDRIQVGAGDGAEGQNEGDQRCTGSQSVREQGDRHVALGKAISHDARTNNGGQQKSGAQGFGGQFAHLLVMTSAVGAAAGLVRFLGANEGADKFVLDQRGDLVDVNPLG